MCLNRYVKVKDVYVRHFIINKSIRTCSELEHVNISSCQMNYYFFALCLLRVAMTELKSVEKVKEKVFKLIEFITLRILLSALSYIKVTMFFIFSFRLN